jgi:hypothetical protein
MELFSGCGVARRAVRVQQVSRLFWVRFVYSQRLIPEGKSMQSRPRPIIFVLAAATLMLFAGLTAADASLYFDNFEVFSGATTLPDNSLLATISNINGGVRITMDALNPPLTVAQKIGWWGFQYDGAVTGYSYVNASTGPEAYVSYNPSNRDKADGDGFFNLWFDFSTSTEAAFDGGERVMYDIMGLTESSFGVLKSTKDNGDPLPNSGGYYSAAHVQALPNDPHGENSAWAGMNTDPTNPVPLPPAAVLLGTGLLGLAGIHKIRKRK